MCQECFETPIFHRALSSAQMMGGVSLKKSKVRFFNRGASQNSFSQFQTSAGDSTFMMVSGLSRSKTN